MPTIHPTSPTETPRKPATRAPEAANAFEKASPSPAKPGPSSQHHYSDPTVSSKNKRKLRPLSLTQEAVPKTITRSQNRPLKPPREVRPHQDESVVFRSKTRLDESIAQQLRQAIPHIQDNTTTELPDALMEQILGNPLSSVMKNYAETEKNADPKEPAEERQLKCREVDQFIESRQRDIAQLLSIRAKEPLIHAIQTYLASGTVQHQRVEHEATIRIPSDPDRESAALLEGYKHYQDNPENPPLTMIQWKKRYSDNAAPLPSPARAPSPTPMVRLRNDTSWIKPDDHAELPRPTGDTPTGPAAKAYTPELSIEKHQAITLQSYSRLLPMASSSESNGEEFIDDELYHVIANTGGETAFNTESTSTTPTDSQHKHLGYFMKAVDRQVAHFNAILRSAKQDKDIEASLDIALKSLNELKRKLALTRPGPELQKQAENHSLAAIEKLASAAAQASQARQVRPEAPKPKPKPVPAPRRRTHSSARSPAPPASNDLFSMNRAGEIRFHRDQVIACIRGHHGTLHAGRHATKAASIVQDALTGITRIHGLAQDDTTSNPLIANEATSSGEAIANAADTALQELSTIRPGRWTRFKDQVRHAFGLPRTRDIVNAARQEVAQLKRFLVIPGSTLALAKNALRSDIAIYITPGNEIATREFREQLQHLAYNIHQGIAGKRKQQRYLDQLKQRVTVISQTCNQLEERQLEKRKEREMLQGMLNQAQLSEQELAKAKQAVSNLAKLDELNDEPSWQPGYIAYRLSYSELPEPLRAGFQHVGDTRRLRDRPAEARLRDSITTQLKALAKRELDWRISR